MISKRKLWVSLASLAIVIVLGATAIGVILSALSSNIFGSFHITYTAKSVEATITGVTADLESGEFVPFGEISFTKNDTEITKTMPTVDLELIDMDGTYENGFGYIIENNGVNGFSVSADVSDLLSDQRIIPQFMLSDKELTFEENLGLGIEDVYVEPQENVFIVIIITLLDETQDINISGSIDFFLDGLADEHVLSGTKLNSLIKGGGEASSETEDNSIQSITFDKYTSDGKYEVDGVDKIAGIEGIDVKGGTKLYKVPNNDKYDVYLLSNEIISPRTFTTLCKNLRGLTKVEFKNIDTSAVTNMSNMFYYCSNLQSVTGLNTFNTENVTDMSYMFFSCSSLQSVTGLNAFNTKNVTNMCSMFMSCSSLTTLDLTGWDTSNVRGSLSPIILLGFSGMSQMFDGCENLQTIKGIESFNTENVVDMANMFNGCSALESLDIGRWKTGNVQNMFGMFWDCSSLTSLDLNNWDMRNVLIMSYMFYQCKGLNTLYIKDWDVTNVVELSSLFSNCTSLESIDLSGWDTSNLTGISSLFWQCSSIKVINLSSWDTSNVTTMEQMFYNCSQLQTIYVGDGWTTQNVTDDNDMFYHCIAIVGGNTENPTHYNSMYTDKEYARVDGENGLPGYLSRKSA